MRKYEKEVFMALLDDEKTVLVALDKVYQRALSDINKRIKAMQADELMASQVYRKQYQETLKGQIEAILERLHTQEYETIEEYLKDSYTDGLVATMYSIHKQGIPLLIPIDQRQVVKALVTNSAISEGLYKSLGVDTKQLRKVIASEISRGIATNMQYGEIARNIANQTGIALKRARSIVITEAHRIQEESSQNAREEAKKQGANIVKQWDATLDHRTRDTHRRLDGQIREVDEPFEIDGKTAMYPGGFGRAEEDCNCRCVALTRAKWGLDEKELETMKERAAFWELDKTDSFEEFKRKYLNAVKE
jgi:uncharacterized protein with gpF-like domain